MLNRMVKNIVFLPKVALIELVKGLPKVALIELVKGFIWSLRTEVYFCHQNQNAKNIGNLTTLLKPHNI
jgi:hypothetical protein